MKKLQTDYFTTIESFRDQFFIERHEERYIRLFERFAKDRTNLKLACIIAYIRAKVDNCLYLVYTGSFQGSGVTQPGYCFLKVDDINNVSFTKEKLEEIEQCTQLVTFKLIKGYIVDQYGVVERLNGFEQYIKDCLKRCS